MELDRCLRWSKVAYKITRDYQHLSQIRFEDSHFLSSYFQNSVALTLVKQPISYYSYLKSIIRNIIIQTIKPMTKWITQNRITQEMKSIAKERPPHLFAAPLPEDLFKWHFTITGPQQTDFHQGIYHGEIVLPKDYPFKPPEVLFMNQNGRFEPFTKICLSITQYHPETWSAGISIRMMLEAIIAIFDDKVPGIGSVEAPPLTRRKLAKDSHAYCCEKCGPIKQILKPRQSLNPLTKQQVAKMSQKQQAFNQFLKNINQQKMIQEQKKVQEKVEEVVEGKQKQVKGEDKQKKEEKPSTIKRIIGWFKKKQ